MGILLIKTKIKLNGGVKYLNEKMISEEFKIKICTIISIAMVGIILVLSLYPKIGDDVIWIGISIALIEVIVYLEQHKLDLLNKR